MQDMVKFVSLCKLKVIQCPNIMAYCKQAQKKVEGTIVAKRKRNNLINIKNNMK